MIRILDIDKDKARMEKFPYQLTVFMNSNKELQLFKELFSKYNEERNVVIGQSKNGYALFTDGKLIDGGDFKESKKSRYCGK